MGIVSVADLEEASGQQVDPGDVSRYQWYIDLVTTFIETYTEQSFAPVVDEVLTCQSDRNGCITFGSLNSVSAVEELDPWSGTYTDWTSGGYGFDGISSIYGLTPLHTYRVTVSYGWDVPPAAIKGVATQLVMAATGIDPGASGGLSRYRVGDVEEVYGVGSDSSGYPVVTLTGLQRTVLDKYAVRARTWRL